MKKFIFILTLFMTVGIVAGPNVWATAYDPTGFPGNLPAPPPVPVINNHGMVGDALLGEFYRAVVDDPYFGPNPVNVATYVSIENVSNKWVAAHVRMRTGRFSVETIDFPILLSPYDVFWFQFQAVPSGTTGVPSAVQIISSDTHTIKLSGLETFNWPFADKSWDGTTLTLTLKNTLLSEFNMSADYKTIVELTQGYVEVFGLFALYNPAEPETWVPRDNFFGIMSKLMNDTEGAQIPNGNATYYASYPVTDEIEATRLPALDVTKDLTGHVFVGDFQTGLYMGYTMKAIKDFRAGVMGSCVPNPTPLGIQTQACRLINGLYRLVPRDFAVANKTTNNNGIQINPATILYNYNSGVYLNPDWATYFGPTWNDGDNSASVDAADAEYGIPKAATGSFSLDEVDDAFFKALYSSTYFNGGFPITGNVEHTFTAMALVFPTKHQHYFFKEWVNEVGTLSALRSAINPTTMGTYQINGYFVDLNEEDAFGPSPGPSAELPWELNFMPMGAASQKNLEKFCFLVKNVPIFDFPSDPWFAGQFELAVGFTFNGLKGSTGLSDPRRGTTNDIDPTTPSGFVKRYNDPGYYATWKNSAFLLSTCNACIGSSAQMLDFEDEGYPHARAYDPSWDNQPFWDPQNPTTGGPLGTCPGTSGYDGAAN